MGPTCQSLSLISTISLSPPSHGPASRGNAAARRGEAVRRRRRRGGEASDGSGGGEAVAERRVRRRRGERQEWRRRGGGGGGAAARRAVGAEEARRRRRGRAAQGRARAAAGCSLSLSPVALSPRMPPSHSERHRRPGQRVVRAAEHSRLTLRDDPRRPHGPLPRRGEAGLDRRTVRGRQAAGGARQGEGGARHPASAPSGCRPRILACRPHPPPPSPAAVVGSSPAACGRLHVRPPPSAAYSELGTHQCMHLFDLLDSHAPCSIWVPLVDQTPEKFMDLLTNSYDLL